MNEHRKQNKPESLNYDWSINSSQLCVNRRYDEKCGDRNGI